MVNFKGVTKETWVRLIVMFVILVNQVSVSVFNFTIIPFSNEEIAEGVATIMTIGVTFWVAWKNNSITTEAQLSDEQMKVMKETNKYL